MSQLLCAILSRLNLVGVMIKKVLAILAVILGVPLFVVSYVPLKNQLAIQTNNLPPSQKLLKVIVPNGRAFEKIKKLAEEKKYMKAVEVLKNITSTNPHDKESQALTSQFQQKVIGTLGACPYGFDSTALKNSSFYKASDGKYIVQVECYLGASQPAYEYYLYTESPNTTIKPLDLTQFDLNYHQISQEDSNFITGLSKFNQKTQELVVSQKYGSIGDCGTLGKYKFERNQFMLEQFFADFKCGDRKLKYEKIYPHNVSLKGH